MELIDAFIFLFAGSLAGVIGALLGLGGGIILVPMLNQYFGLPMHNAVAISIISIIATSSGVTVGKVKKGLINLELSTILESASVFGGVTGALIALSLESQVLLKAFSVWLLIFAAMMLISARKKDLEEDQKDFNIGLANRGPLVAFIALISGVVSGLFGIGGGTITVPGLVIAARIPMKIATACSSHVMAVTAAASGVIYLLDGKVLATHAVVVMLGVFLGVRIAVRYLQNFSSRALKYIFVLVLVLQAYRMW